LLSTAATLVVLLPWALRNRREHGVLSFSDEHGGITALIGANPNSEGTYTRALNRMFKDLTGRSVIAEPHRETDRLAFDLAKDWTRFEPGYASAWRAEAERLFWSEWHLLYWPIGRPGVLVGPAQRWFAPRMEVATRSPMVLVRPVRAVRRRRRAGRRRAPAAPAGADPLPAGADRHVHGLLRRAALPRPHRDDGVPIAAFALHRLWSLARTGVARAGARGARARGDPDRHRTGRRGRVDGGGVVDLGGGRTPARHAPLGGDVWTVDGKAVLAKWRRHGPTVGPSPIAGAPNGVHVTAGADGRAAAEVLVASLPAGRYHLDGEVERDEARDARGSSAAPAGELRLTLADAARAQPLAEPIALAPQARAAIHARFTHRAARCACWRW